MKPKETGLRACFVIGSVFLLGMIENGIVKSFGTLVDDLVLQYETDVGTLGLVIGLANGLAYIFAPFSAPFANRANVVRPMMIFGSLVTGLAIAMASFATNMAGFTAAMVISGLGFALVYLPAVVVFGRYFTNHFALAFGIAELGSGLSLLFPLLAERLMEATGLRGTLLILGGICLNMMVCSALLRDPRTLRSDGSPSDPEAIGKEGKECCDVDPHDEPLMCNRVDDTHCQTFKSGRQQNPQASPQAQNDLSNGDEYQVMIHDQGHEDIESRNSPEAETSKLTHKPTNEKSTDNIDSETNPRIKHSWISFLTTPFRLLWSFLDFSLCMDEPFFNFILLGTFLWSMVRAAWYIFFVPHALAKGITLSTAVLIFLMCGVGEMIGAFIQGPIVDRGWMTSSGLFMVMSLINGIVYFVDPALKSPISLGFAGCLNGIFLGGSCSLTSVILQKSVPHSRFATSYGLSSLTYGIAEPVGGFTTGWIASQIGYEMAFVYLGVLSIAILVALIPAYYHYDYKRAKIH